MAQGAQLGARGNPYGWNGGGGGGGFRGRGICINIVDSLHCTEETMTTFKSNKTPIKKKTISNDNLFNIIIH